MRRFLIVIALLVAGVARESFAGGPEIEMEKGRINGITFDHRGIVIKVTGTVKLFVPKVEGDDQSGGNAKWITAPMKDGEIRFLGSQLDAVTFDSRQRYRARIEKLSGTYQLIQMWGTTATVEGGHVTHIVAREVGILAPTKEERRFDTDRLYKELDSERPAK